MFVARSLAWLAFGGLVVVSLTACGEGGAALLTNGIAASEAKPINPCSKPVAWEKKYKHVLSFQYTGYKQTWTVPSTLTWAFVIANGAAGYGGTTQYVGAPGYGGCIATTLRVAGISDLDVYVGGQGNGCAGGFNGGGSAGGSGSGGNCGGGGGGASGLTTHSNGRGGYLIIASGGGGAGHASRTFGGWGGYKKGQDGGSDCYATYCFSYGGNGGSNNLGGGTGGAGQGPYGSGTGYCYYGDGARGSMFAGGTGGSISYACGGTSGGGGGGGWYGGGGGGSDRGNGSGGGGGTSSIFANHLGTIYAAQGISQENGSVIICWN